MFNSDLHKYDAMTTESTVHAVCMAFVSTSRLLERNIVLKKLLSFLPLPSSVVNSHVLAKSEQREKFVVVKSNVRNYVTGVTESDKQRC